MSNLITSKCWASIFNNCSNKISLEHLVSKSLFSTRNIKVQGFDWCKEEKEIGLKGFGSKILCTKHNSQLSVLDSEAGKLMDSLEYGVKLGERRNRLKPKKWSIHKRKVKGPLVERWFLNTLINLSQKNKSQFILPLEQLVNISFGEELFPERTGLHATAVMGTQITINRALGFKPLWKDGLIVAGIFEFAGFEFILALTDVSDFYKSKIYNYHHKHYQLKSGKHVSFKLSFLW